MSTRCQIEFYDMDPTDGAEPLARIYKHADGYPKGILPMLKYVQSVLKKDHRPYGPRLHDPEWAAAEFVTQFRLPSNWTCDKPGGEPLYGGRESAHLTRYRGNIYVTQQLHQDIEYLYRVECCPDGWIIRIFRPEYDEGHDITGFSEVRET